MSTSAAGAISEALQQLQLKLLDLTGRNKLINYKHTLGKSLQFVQGQPAALYQRLVESNNKLTVPILGLPEPARRFWTERNGRIQRPDPRDWAKAEGIPRDYDIPVGEAAGSPFLLRALMYPDDLARHCRKIERESVLAIEETGANMLFLVLGFLEFPDQRDSVKSVIAPLISIPVVLLNKDIAGIQSFSLQYTGDDVSENISLREKLKNDFGINLPELAEDRINVEAYFSEISNNIEQKLGFSLKRRVSLCLLSFTNMLLLRDLDPTKWPIENDLNALIDHPIVREIFEGKPGEADAGINIPPEHAVEDGPGAVIPLIYDADSSQHSALVDVLSVKKNLVIEGPPGTGKSQTITNLIAACLFEGKKVLFVAEKMAALEVVKSRLLMAGLDPFVLELHSDKANKKRVLEEVAKRIAFRGTSSADLPQLIQQMESYRKDLKAYTDLINSVIHNEFGLTLHQVMWRAEKYRVSIGTEETLLTQIAVSDANSISAFVLTKRLDCLRHLSAQYRLIGSFDTNSTFWGFFPEQIIPGEEIRLANLFRTSVKWANNWFADVEKLADVLGEKIVGLTEDFAKSQLEVLTQLRHGISDALPLCLIPRFFRSDQNAVKAKKALMVFSSQLERYQELYAPVQLALNKESAVSNDILEKIHALAQMAEGVGVNTKLNFELPLLSEMLKEAISKAKSAIGRIVEFASKNAITFDGSRQNLQKIADFSDLISNVPEEHLHLQAPGLCKDGAQRAIESLAQTQREWVELASALNVQLYIDALPPEDDIKQAILILREGDAWYRIFQTRWRSAVSLHQSLQRSKARMSSRNRLQQLERVVAILGLKEKWKLSPTWVQYVGKSAPVDPESLDGYLTLSKWNRQIKIASEEIQTTCIDLEGLTSEKARMLRRTFSLLKAEIDIVFSSIEKIELKLNRLGEFANMHLVEKVLAKSGSFVSELEAWLPWLGAEAKKQASLAEVIAGCEAALERADLKLAIEGNTELQNLMGESYLGLETDVSGALESIAFGQRLDSLNLSAQIKAKLKASHPLRVADQICEALVPVCGGFSSLANLSVELARFGEFDQAVWIGSVPGDDLQKFVISLVDCLDACVQDSELLIPWSLYVNQRKEAKKLGLDDFILFLEEKQIKPDELADAYAYCTYGSIVRKAFRSYPELGRFTGLKHSQIRIEFQRLDKEIIRLRGESIGLECSRNAIPPGGKNGIRVDEKTEMVLLNYLLPQQRPRMSVRKILMHAGQSIQTLKPCFMMGPQAVAQFLTPGAIKFDLVIMDEASQLKPEEAIGAIARGGQLVVVGDPKQLPPTSFFSRMIQSGEDDDQFTTTDAESILDICSSHFQPSRTLRWHYRSQHHSLIAFSNRHFYRDNLIIFPSPYGQGGPLGVRVIYLSDAVYENQTNVREAKRVVDAVVEHILHRHEESLGVVAINIKQRDLIAELIDDRLKAIPSAATYREKWKSEGQPLFIKNLENVQGDERDAIIISTTYGRPAGSDAVRQNFGPISRQGGWRRLNVLFTRAKKSIAVYTSLRPEDIVLDGTTQEGTKALRNYLEYARTGSLIVSEDTGQEPDSDFEVCVIDMLRQRGYEMTPQLGVAGYRIDIAVKHPDFSGSYLAAIECDGASYHSALSVRDRDRIRQEILEALGWRGRIWRIWSTDWFRNPREESKKLIGFLEDLRKNWKLEQASGDSWIEEGELSPMSLVPSNAISAKDGVDDEPRSINQGETARSVVESALIVAEDDLEVEVGDVVRYVDISKPEDVITVQITQKLDDFSNGLVSEGRPLAQTLLGAVKGDEVYLHVPGSISKVFRILWIQKNSIFSRNARL